MNRIVLISAILILVSGSLMAQSNSDAGQSGTAQTRNEAQAEAQAEIQAEQDKAREAQLRKAQKQSRQAIGAAASPEWPQAESDAEPDDPDHDNSVRKSGTGRSKAADSVDHGNQTSSEMLQRRDQSKAVKQEYQDSGTKQKGKKPWHKSSSGDSGSDGEASRGEGDATTTPKAEPDQGKNKNSKKPQSRPDRNDDKDHH